VSLIAQDHSGSWSNVPAAELNAAKASTTAGVTDNQQVRVRVQAPSTRARHLNPRIEASQRPAGSGNECEDLGVHLCWTLDLEEVPGSLDDLHP
jgi:hypothetical protein